MSTENDTTKTTFLRMTVKNGRVEETLSQPSTKITTSETVDNRPEQTGTDEALEHVNPVRG